MNRLALLGGQFKNPNSKQQKQEPSQPIRLYAGRLVGFNWSASP
jgi:hypothetical protein